MKEKNHVINHSEIILKNIKLAYDLDCIEGKEIHIPLNKTTVIEGASGRGKTSILNVLLGITGIAGGMIQGNNLTYSAVFQEDRLLEELTGVKNIKIVEPCIKNEDIERELEKLLPVSYIRKPINTYSRGMKRRVAIVRAMLKESDIVVMDEPFAGLDEELKKRTSKYITEVLNGRTLIIAVHEKKEAEYLRIDNVISL